MKKKLFDYKVFVFGLFLVVGFTIYSNTFNSEFHFDDLSSITNQTIIRSFDYYKNADYWLNLNNRALAMYTLALNYELGGYDIVGYHVINILIHIITSFLVYVFLRQIMVFLFIKKKWGKDTLQWFPFFAALIFLCHPIQTQSVTYVVQRMTSMAALFYLGGLILYLQGRTIHTKKNKPGLAMILYFTAVICGILAMLSKQYAVTFPIAVLLTEFFFVRNKSGKPYVGFLMVSASLLVLAFIFYVLWFSLPAETDVISRKDYLLTQSRVILKYIQLLFVPVSQNLDYDFSISTYFFEPKVFFSFLILAGILVAGFVVYFRNKLISFGILWFFLVLSVESSFIPIRDVIFEHRLYLPLMGFSMIVSVLLFTLFKNKSRNAILVLVVLSVIFSSLTYARNNVWKTEYSLWRDIADKSPAKARPWANLGFAVMQMDSVDAAIGYYEKALAIDREYPIAWNNLGLAYQKKGDLRTAAEHFNTSIKLSTDYVSALNNFGCVLIDLGHSNLALPHLNKALELDPAHERLYYNTGLAHLNLGNYEEAADFFVKAIRLTPYDPDSYNNLGQVLYFQKKFQESIEVYNDALRLDPDSYIILNNIANSYTGLLDFEKAKEYYKRALEYNPDYESARSNLQILYDLENPD